MAQLNKLVSDLESKDKGTTAAVPNVLKIEPIIQVIASSSIQESNSAHEVSVSGKGSYNKTYKEMENADSNTLSLVIPKRPPPLPSGMMKSRSTPTRKPNKDSDRNDR